MKPNQAMHTFSYARYSHIHSYLCKYIEKLMNLHLKIMS